MSNSRDLAGLFNNVANQAEAEAGADNVKRMTPLVTRQGFNAYAENSTTLTGTANALDISSGRLHSWTLTAASTLTDNLAAGESVTLLLNTAGFSMTWPTVSWISGNPILDATGTNILNFTKVGTTLFGTMVGHS